jgi:hypothetical protein
VAFRVMESKFAVTILRGKQQMIIDELVEIWVPWKVVPMCL